MQRKLISKWWWLGLCVALEATVSVFYFDYAKFGTHSLNAVVFLGELTLAAGICTIAACALSAIDGKRWLLVLNGVVCSCLGLVLIFKTAITFRTIAFLIVVMAMSLGLYELITPGLLRRQRAQEWLAKSAGVVAVGFALVFLAFVFRWVRLDPTSPAETFLWLGSYFGFSAACMLETARRIS